MTNCSQQKMVMAIDVGGTKTRVQSDHINCNSISSRKIIAERNIGSKRELKSLFEELLETYDEKFICVVDFAGPIINQQAKITNWKGKPFIRKDELIKWGMPKDTIILNDLEAAAYGVIELEEKSRINLDCLTLFTPHKIYENNFNDRNMVLIIPGTGLGTAGIVTIRLENGKFYKKPIASEIQHFPVSPVNKDHEKLIEFFKRNRSSEKNYSWEDFVSGTGLKNIYEGLCAIKGNNESNTDRFKSIKDPANWIAENAIKRNDPLCINSMDMYCRCMGKVAQIMALVYKPYGGIFIGGDVSLRNSCFIKESSFVQEMQQNQIHRDLLKKFPIYLIKKELNINGCFWIGRILCAKIE